MNTSTGYKTSRLRDTYETLTGILGDSIEPYEAVRLVEDYRQYFKPITTKVVLLAESHVYTSAADMNIRIPNIDGLPGYPSQYAKFVYCLGYGEWRLTNDPEHPRRDGTPQFWKILYGCANSITDNESFAPVLGVTPFSQRIRNKTEILLRLKERGVWLVDTSIAALYHKGKKLKNMHDALKASWERYTREVLLQAQPEHVICIGKGVSRVVEDDLRRYFAGRYSVVAQPNAFLSKEAHMANYIHYSRICNP